MSEATLDNNAKVSVKPSAAVQNESLRSILVYAPHTGENVGQISIQSPEHVSEAVQRARVAQQKWARLDFSQRASALGAFRRMLVEHCDALVEALVRETGKARMEALHEVVMVCDLCAYYEAHAQRILARQPIHMRWMKHIESYLYYAPVGVVGVISPWNFPFSIPMRGVITALAAGNAAVLKPSERTSLMMLETKKLFDQSGVDADLFQVVTGDGATGSALISAGIDKMVFTGAVATGRKVAMACADKLIPSVLELGGKAAMIICEDAHLERAARAAVFGGFLNSGQVCISVERVFVHAAVHDRFVARVVELVNALKQGNPVEGMVDVGAVTFENQVTVADRLIADAKSKGAKVLTGGALKEGAGRFFAPTVLGECTLAMDVMHKEIFGPLLPIMKVESEAQAITLANDSEVGLFHYVFTEDTHKGQQMAEQLNAGTVMINDVLTGYLIAEAPFGGVKHSGWGREHGEEGLKAMCHLRHVAVSRLGFLKRDPYWFPYSDALYRWVRRIFKWLMGAKNTPRILG